MTNEAHRILLIAAWCQEKIHITRSGTCHVDGMLETLLQKMRASGNHSCEIGNEHRKQTTYRAMIGFQGGEIFISRVSFP
jgi:hypothetical protein